MPKDKKLTTGDLNKIIDSLIHPLAKTDSKHIVLDAILYGMVEQNPPTIIQKFIKYNLSKIIEQSTRKD